MKKYIKNILIILLVLVFVSFVVFMLFFKKYTAVNNNISANKNNVAENNKGINTNNIIINKDLSDFKNNFLKCNDSLFNNTDNNVTYNVISNINDASKCIVSVVKIDKSVANTVSCFIPKSLLNEGYINGFINDFSGDKMKENVPKYKECSFNSNTLPEVNKNIEDFKGNFVKCNKALFYSSESYTNYNVFDDVSNKDKCVFIIDVLNSVDSKSSKTIICNIKKESLSLKLYDLIMDGIKNNKLNNIENVVCK